MYIYNVNNVLVINNRLLYLYIDIYIYIHYYIDTFVD